MRRLVVGAICLIVIGAVASCDREDRFVADGRDADPLPADLEAALGQWSDADGVPLSQHRPFVMDIWRGSAHCGWEDLLFLAVSWPLGTEVTGPYMGDPHTRLFVRLSSTDQLPTSMFRSTFDASAELPDDAFDTGYHRDGWHLWISPSRIDRAAWLLHEDTVERWPASKDVIGCI